MRRSSAALALASSVEAATGLLLLAFPVLVVRLLCGWEVSGPSESLSRFLGIALLALGVACRPSTRPAQPLLGMLVYTTLAACFLSFLGATGNAGIFLWPAVAAHVLLAILLGRVYLKAQAAPAS